MARVLPGIGIFTHCERPALRTNLIAAVTVFGVLVPSAMAYADLAGLPPEAGLYVAIGAMVGYALFGTTRHLILGPEATAAILTASAVAPLEPGLIVYRFDVPVIFANAPHLAEQVRELVTRCDFELRCIILDAEAISDVDTSSLEMLEGLSRELRQRGIVLWIGCGHAADEHGRAGVCLRPMSSIARRPPATTCSSGTHCSRAAVD